MSDYYTLGTAVLGTYSLGGVAIPEYSAPGTYPDNQLFLYIGGVQQTDYGLLARNFSVHETLNKNGSMVICVKSGAGTLYKFTDIFVYCLSYNLSKIFGGIIKEVTKKYIMSGLFEYTLSCQSYIRYIQQVKGGYDDEDNPTGVEYEADTQTEKKILTDLIITYAPDIYIDNDTTVDTKVIVGETIDYINWENAGLFEAINELAAIHGRVWWIDANKAIHYINPQSPEASVLALSDAPDFSDTFPYFDLEYTDSDNGYSPEEDEYIDQYWGTLTCWHGIWHVGQGLSIVNADEGWDGVTLGAGLFLITDVEITLDKGHPVFKLSFGSPYNFQKV